MLASPVVAADSIETWDPTKTWVFMVGVLDYKNPSIESMSEPNEKRCDLHLAQLLEQRGVPKGQIKFLQDKDATQTQVEQEFTAFVAKATGTLMVYFDGHGDTDEEKGSGHFLLHDTDDSPQRAGWYIPSIFETIEKNFKGSRTYLFADCCFSGLLAKEAERHSGSYACLTSALFSCESTMNWTYTQCLLGGFGGDARVDADHDGKISLSELGKFTNHEMAFSEGQLGTFATQKFPHDIIIGSAKAMPNSRYGERVIIDEGEEAEPAFVVDTEKDRLKVSYYGEDADTKAEWVDASLARPWNPTVFPVGSAVEVLDPEDNIWYASTVVESHLGVHRIRYEGDEAEWVSEERIRKAK